MALAFVSCCEYVFESTRLRLCRSKSIRTVHRMHKNCREQWIADALKSGSHRAPHTRLDGRDEPERRPRFLGAALVNKLARQLSIFRERCRHHNVPGLLKGAITLFVPSVAINRYDSFDSKNRQNALLQELTEFSSPANNQYGVAILRSVSFTWASFSSGCEHGSAQ